MIMASKNASTDKLGEAVVVDVGDAALAARETEVGVRTDAALSGTTGETSGELGVDGGDLELAIVATGDSTDC